MWVSCGPWKCFLTISSQHQSKRLLLTCWSLNQADALVCYPTCVLSVIPHAEKCHRPALLNQAISIQEWEHKLRKPLESILRAPVQGTGALPSLLGCRLLQIKETPAIFESLGITRGIFLAFYPDARVKPFCHSQQSGPQAAVRSGCLAQGIFLVSTQVC